MQIIHDELPKVRVKLCGVPVVENGTTYGNKIRGYESVLVGRDNGPTSYDISGAAESLENVTLTSTQRYLAT